MSTHKSLGCPATTEIVEFVPEKESNTLLKKVIVALSLVLFTLLATLNPIIVRIAHKEAKKHGNTFIGSTTVFATEVCKLLICCVIVPIKQRSLKKFMILLIESFTVNKMETVKICVPALMYVVRNFFYFFALQRIDVMLFSLTFQLRILTTVLLMMIVLKRRFSAMQWLSLLISLLGVVIVQLGGPIKSANHEVTSSLMNKILGLGAVGIMCLTTAFGSVYMEAVMKQSEADIFLQNIRLGLVSLPLSVLAMGSNFNEIVQHGFFFGWNVYVWVVVIMSAVGGLVVCAVLLHADNVRKGFCQALALGGTTVLAILLGDSEFSFYLLTGVFLVIVSVILYTLATRWKKKQTEFQALVESMPEEMALLKKENNPAV